MLYDLVIYFLNTAYYQKQSIYTRSMIRFFSSQWPVGAFGRALVCKSGVSMNANAQNRKYESTAAVRLCISV